MLTYTCISFEHLCNRYFNFDFSSVQGSHLGLFSVYCISWSASCAPGKRSVRSSGTFSVAPCVHHVAILRPGCSRDQTASPPPDRTAATPSLLPLCQKYARRWTRRRANRALHPRPPEPQTVTRGPRRRERPLRDAPSAVRRGQTMDQSGCLKTDLVTARLKESH